MASKYKNKQPELFTKQNLQDFGKDYVKILTTFLKIGRSPFGAYKATGTLINSVDYRLQEIAKRMLIVIEANDYLQYVDEGRKPGKYPNIQAIRDWVNVKGISQDAVFPIAHKIYKFGIKPANVIGKTIKEIETSSRLNAKYEDALSDNIETIVLEEFNIEFKK